MTVRADEVRGKDFDLHSFKSLKEYFLHPTLGEYFVTPRLFRFHFDLDDMDRLRNEAKNGPLIDFDDSVFRINVPYVKFDTTGGSEHKEVLLRLNSLASQGAVETIPFDIIPLRRDANTRTLLPEFPKGADGTTDLPLPLESLDYVYSHERYRAEIRPTDVVPLGNGCLRIGITLTRLEVNGHTLAFLDVPVFIGTNNSPGLLCHVTVRVPHVEEVGK